MVTSYEDDALGTCAAEGVAAIEFWCLNPACNHRGTAPVGKLLKSYGPAATLLMLARRARCNVCGKQGCQVQRPRRPAYGTPEWTAWRATEILRLRARLAALEDPQPGSE